MIKDIKKEVEGIKNWICKYVADCKADGVVIGNSGGKDCAAVIALSSLALGKDKVLAVHIPCNSKQADYEDAKLVSDTFGVKQVTINIEEPYKALENEIENTMKKEDIQPKEEWRNREAKINTKPRLRMTTLYYLAQNLNYLVIGTGNKCESVVGYTTKWGDNAYDFNPIGEFTVDEVLQIGKYLGVPDRVINKAPNDGLGNMTDEEKLGVTYKQIAEYIETGSTDSNALEIIKLKEKNTEHKRKPIPTYHRL